MILARIMAKPLALIPEASTDWAEAKATYRFMDNAKVDQDAVLAAHRTRTLERAAQHPVVLAIGDTAMLTTVHPRTTGLGPLADIEHHGLLRTQRFWSHPRWSADAWSTTTFGRATRRRSPRVKNDLAKRSITERRATSGCGRSGCRAGTGVAERQRHRH